MFCFQCQETAKNSGCTTRGVCGKTDEVAGLQDVLVYALKGLSAAALAAEKEAKDIADAFTKVADGLFSTITNANFNEKDFIKRITDAVKAREKLLAGLKDASGPALSHPAAAWTPHGESQILAMAKETGVLQTVDEDIRSLREILIYGAKGASAYLRHAAVLGREDPEIYRFVLKALAACLDDNIGADELTGLVLECGEFGVKAMALLDGANTGAYGHPEPTSVNIGAGGNPGILISGHDMKDMEELLKQTEKTGVDVYTHSEMLPANAYPAFKKYKHFRGNYGNAWHLQKKEFRLFNGPILMTTNCIVAPDDSYKDRIFTTGIAGYPGVGHIEEDENGKKDFSGLVRLAKQCPPPEEIETGSIPIGFARNSVLNLAGEILQAVNSGAIRKFVVMAGCDGRMPERKYYTEFARALPQDTVILTAGCAKYRYNKLGLGEINGIPRVLDAGQCNDSYSLAFIALKLKEALGLDDINKLPIVYNIAWYEQKAVIVLLSLLSLGIKNIRLGPTLPAFISPNVLKVLIDKFQIAGIKSVEEDVLELAG